MSEKTQMQSPPARGSRWSEPQWRPTPRPQLTARRRRLGIIAGGGELCRADGREIIQMSEQCGKRRAWWSSGRWRGSGTRRADAGVRSHRRYKVEVRAAAHINPEHPHPAARSTHSADPRHHPRSRCIRSFQNSQSLKSVCLSCAVTLESRASPSPAVTPIRAQCTRSVRGWWHTTLSSKTPPRIGPRRAEHPCSLKLQVYSSFTHRSAYSPMYGSQYRLSPSCASLYARYAA